MTRLLWLFASVVPVGIALVPQTKSVEPVDFERKLAPIVKAKCLGCHGDTSIQGGLDLRTPEAWKKGGVSGKLFIPGDPEKSLLIRRLVDSKPMPQMPMGFPPLSDQEIGLFKTWITQGAKFESIPTYASDIEPILKANCVVCHTGASAKAGLDLTTYEGVMKVVQTGHPEHSEIMTRLKGEGGKTQMPMGFAPLKPEVQAKFAEWIKLGAPKGEAAKAHWAYVPPAKPEVPALESTWIKNPIDAFVLDRLKREGLRPSAPAQKEALIRRASLDLIGLPPTEAELDKFVSGKETYGAALDRLLASPHYGERMATPWLDLARFADTHGYEKDLTRSAWKYRDWVVDAFNKNMPYDQFTIEQIAGDLLPKPTVDQMIATGFNRNAMTNLEGGVDQEEAMYEVRNDRVATTSVTWLGATVACARCHDHKYDPISQKDYFRFYAFFNNNVIEPRGDKSISEEKYFEPTIEVPSSEQIQAKKQLEVDLKKATAALEAKNPDVAEEKVDWLAKSKKGIWTEVSAEAEGIAKEAVGYYVTTKTPRATFDLKLKVPEGTRGLRLVAMTDSRLPRNGPGQFPNGNFVLSKVSLSGKPITRVAASFEQNGFPARGVLDEDPDSGWAIDPQTGKEQELVIESDQPLSGEVNLKIEFESHRYDGHVLGRFGIYATHEADATRFVMPADIKDAIAKGDDAKAGDYFSRVASSNRQERERMRYLQESSRKLQSQIPTAQVMREAKGKTEAAVRHRGEYMSPGEIVKSGTPEALGVPAGGSRLNLAKWMASKKNPLTARVQVNRLWEMVFGRGLVETSENFGTQGSAPSHPELLDWLAVTYMESGWDNKKMLKLILSSNTYRQSSATTKALTEKDPYNELLARGPRFRLTSEAIRDSALVASGLLNEKLGGPPVFPFQPDGVWDSPYTNETWVNSPPEGAYRRSLYTFWKRTASYASAMALDAGSRETCLVRRPRTNTPLQALALLNDPAVFAASQALGKRYAASQGTLETKLSRAFRAVTSRTPKPQELQRLVALHAKIKASKGEEMAWTMVGNVLLNLDEAITKE